MKVFAIATIVPPFGPEERAQFMPKEAPHTLQMYLDGIIEQFWFRDGVGPVFLLNVDSVESAREIVGKMPLVAGGKANYEFWPVGPLAPLRLLIPAS